MRRLCTVDDVNRVFNTEGRFTEDEINEEIEKQSDDIYEECGDPIAATKTCISKNNTLTDDFYLEYYLGENRVYQIERVFVGTITKRELTETEDYSVAKTVGILKFNTSTVGSARLTDQDDLVMYYVPMLYTKWCGLRVAEALLEKLDMITNGKASKELEVIRKKLSRHDILINNRMGVVFSSSNRYYDDEYGINLKRVKQDHDQNLYLYRNDGIED